MNCLTMLRPDPLHIFSGQRRSANDRTEKVQSRTTEHFEATLDRARVSDSGIGVTRASRRCIRLMHVRGLATSGPDRAARRRVRTRPALRSDPARGSGRRRTDVIVRRGSRRISRRPGGGRSLSGRSVATASSMRTRRPTGRSARDSPTHSGARRAANRIGTASCRNSK